MNLVEEFDRLNMLIKQLEEQNKRLQEQLDTLHRTYGCSSNPNHFTSISRTVTYGKPCDCAKSAEYEKGEDAEKF